MKILTCFFVSIAYLLTGCSPSKPNLSFANLHLTAKPVEDVLRTGDPIEVVYLLNNTGSAALRGCVTFGAGFDLWVNGTVRQNMESVDHPMCRRTFTLAPLESIKWSEQVVMKGLTPGDATFTGWIKLAIPDSCGKYGCDQFTLRASDEPLAVVSHKP